MEEILARVWHNLIERTDGTMSFRVYFQPLMAAILAIRAGIRNAREGRRGYLWALINPKSFSRRELVQHGWGDIGKVFVVAAILDSIYQLIEHKGVFLGELLVSATVLAIIPYILIRGPANRIASHFIQVPQPDDDETIADGQPPVDKDD